MLYPESLVWIPEHRVFGRIVGGLGAYYSMIAFKHDGLEYEILMENDEFELVEEDLIEYDND